MRNIVSSTSYPQGPQVVEIKMSILIPDARLVVAVIPDGASSSDPDDRVDDALHSVD